MEDLTNHLAPDDRERLLRLAAPPRQVALWLLHLLSCRLCRERVCTEYPEPSRRLVRSAFGRDDWPSPRSGRATATAVLRRAERRLRRSLEEVEQAPLLFNEVLAQPSPRRRLLVENSGRFHTGGLACFLLEWAEGLWEDDPRQAEEMTELSLVILGRLSRDRYDPRQLNDWTARALAFRGNCRRIRSNLRGANRDFERARVYLAQGAGDPADLAEVDDHETSLCRDQRRFEQATRLAARAAGTYRRLGDVQGEVRAVIKQAMNLRNAGDPDEALELLTELSESFTVAEMGSKNSMYVQHNRAVYLAECGRLDEARALLPAIRRLAAAHGDRLQSVRVGWLEAMIDDRAGEVAAAVGGYERTRSFYAEQGMAFDAALVTLELTALHLRHGRMGEARDLAAELVPIFASQDVSREAVAALSLFFQALEQERATEALARRVAACLERPPRAGLRFEGPADR